MEKDTKITESMALNLRFEMFNVFNHTNFLTSGVVGNANSSQFGQATSAAAGPHRTDQCEVHLLAFA